MKAFFETADRVPVTLLILLAYLTLAVLTHMNLSVGLVDEDQEFLKRMVELGSLDTDRLFQGEWWRLLTSAFLHFGLLHLLFNGYALMVIGPALELQLGPLRFGALYIVTAITGSVAALFWNDFLVHVAGGSGALFGLIGCYLAQEARAGRSPLEFTRTPRGRQLLGVIATNLLIGVLIPVISNSAHIGGLVGGFVMGTMFLETGRVKPDRLFRATQLGWIVLLLAATAYSCAPVANRHWLLQRYFAAEQPAERSGYARALVSDPSALQRMLREYRYKYPNEILQALRWDASPPAERPRFQGKEPNQPGSQQPGPGQPKRGR